MLNWPQPRAMLDLYTEFRCLTNGLQPLHGNGLVGALLHYGLPTIGGEEKEVKQRQRLQADQPATPTLNPMTLSPDDHRLLDALAAFPAAHATICAGWFNPPLATPTRKETPMSDTTPNLAPAPAPPRPPRPEGCDRLPAAARLAPALYGHLKASTSNLSMGLKAA